jgi:hypothetical protein
VGSLSREAVDEGHELGVIRGASPRSRQQRSMGRVSRRA